MTITMRIQCEKTLHDFGWAEYDNMDEAVERVYTLTGMHHEVAARAIDNAKRIANEKGTFVWPFGTLSGFVVEVANH